MRQRRAARAQPVRFDVSPLYLDWTLTRTPKEKRLQGLATWHARGLNTLGRCQRHYGDPTPGLCQHGCEEEDTATHRLLRCQGLRDLRCAHKLRPDECELLATGPRCTPESKLWLSSHPDIDVPTQHVLSLWAQKEHVQTWVQTQLQRCKQTCWKAPLTFTFYYVKENFGLHPALKRRIVGWKETMADMAARALATMAQISRMEWEADAIMAAAVIASIAEETVIMRGFKRQTQGLAPSAWASSSNQHLLPVVAAMWPNLQFEDLPPDDTLEVNEKLRGELRDETMHLIAELEVNNSIAKKVHAVIEDSFQFYPQAAATAHSKGQRGGIRSSRHFGGVFGREAVGTILELHLDVGSDGDGGSLFCSRHVRYSLLCVYAYVCV